MDDIRLGTLLLEHSVLQEADLDRCLEVQSLTGGVRPLGHILVEQGFIDQKTLDELLALQAQRAQSQRGTLEVGSTDGEPGSSPYLIAAVSAGATELFISEGRPIVARVAGQLQSLTPDPLDAPEVWSFVREFMGHDVLEQIAESKEVTRSFVQPGLCRGRISAFRHFDGIGVSVRIHAEERRTAEDLAIPAEVVTTAKQGKGLLLVAGERGSGLTETMHALLDTVASVPGRHVLVLDNVFEADAPEPASGTRVVRRQVRADGYAEALRAGICEEPDAIVAADISTPGAFEMALRAAEGGRFVIGAVHAATALNALTRVLTGYSENDVPRVRATLSSVLAGVLCRKLVPDADHVSLLPVSEYLHVDDAVREVLRQGRISNVESLLRMEDNPGFSFDQSLMDIHLAGSARFEDVFHRATDKTWFLQTAHGGAK